MAFLGGVIDLLFPGDLLAIHADYASYASFHRKLTLQG